MSSLSSLSIQGIRSFSPLVSENIEFYTPLTIIVGHNGAGKTTIIECLKYATTGELPPNSKGAAFIHDPKLTSDTEVKAQVRLRFINTIKQKVLVVRSVQCTAKRGDKVEYRTLENVLAIEDQLRGASSISGKCSDLDAEVPLQLGVSKAVLENVIFCHQEDSFWPLSDSATLKRKFDDIFAASQYTRVLVAIKKTAKEMEMDLKSDRTTLAWHSERREITRQKRLELELVCKNLEEKKAAKESFDIQLYEVDETIATLSDAMDRLAGLQIEQERIEHELKLNIQLKNDIEASLVIMNESDEELNKYLNLHANRSNETTNNNSRLKGMKESIEQTLVSLRIAYSKLCLEKGIVSSEIAQTNAKRTERTNYFHQLVALLFKGDDPSLANISESNAYTRFEWKLRQLKDQLFRMQGEFREKDVTLMEKVQSLMGQHSAMLETKKIKQRQCEENNKKVSQIIDQLATISTCVNGLVEMQQKMAEEELALINAKESYAAAAYEGQLGVMMEKRKQIEQLIVKCHEQLAQMHRLADVRAKYQVKKLDRDKRVENLDRFWAELQTELKANKESFGEHSLISVGIEDMEKEIDKKFKEKGHHVAELSARLETARTNSSILQSKLNHAQTLLDRKTKLLNEKKLRITDAFEGSLCENIAQFNAVLGDAEEQFASVMIKLNGTQASKATFEAFRKQADATNACPLCDRCFSSGTNEQIDFMMGLSNKIASLPETLSRIESEKNTLEKKLAEFKSFRPLFDDIERLQVIEIPDLQMEIKDIEGENDRALGVFEDVRLELSREQLEEKRLGILKKKGDELGKLLREMSTVQIDLKYLEEELKEEGFNYDDKVEGVQTELKRLQTQSSQLQSEIEQITQEMKTKLAELSRKESRFRDYKENIMKIQLQQGETTRLEQSKTELEQATQVLGKEIRELGSEVEKTAKLVEVEKAQRESSRLEHDRVTEEMRKNIDKVQGIFSSYVKLEEEITRFIQERGEDPLGKVTTELEQIEVALAKSKSELQFIDEEIIVSNKEAGEVEMFERKIQDNLKHRELDKRIKEMKTRLASVQYDLGNFDRKHTQHQLSRQSNKKDELANECSRLRGMIGEIEATKQRYEFDLSKPEHQDAEKEYRKCFVTMMAKATAAEDLSKYAKAFDQAIMKYHSLKMDEINKIVREIWTSTYQGSDIDGIEIRTDIDTTASNRSYNYRVVMLKGGVELDMRGRSSAGQRVLASLIIRLALAETFGQHCGVLALDEPTTNLDRDNVEGLARALVDIVQYRREQSNFQLILITHDEDFVQALGRQECADYYYRIGKDEHQHSIIERQSFISEL